MILKWVGLASLGIATLLASYQYSLRFLDWVRFQSIGTRDYVVEKLSLMFIEIPPHRILIGQVILSAGIGALIFLMCLPKVGLGFLLGAIWTIIGWRAPRPVVDFFVERRTRKFVTQMVDALGLMSNAMRSGLSIGQAMGLVTQEMPDPIRQEFGLVLNQNKLGVSLEEAFVNLSKRIIADDVEMFVTAINILKETGGNLAESLETIVGTIRERVKVQSKISAMTAAGFFQGMIVLSVPAMLAFVFYQSDPDLMAPLFNTTLGLMVVATVILMELVGLFLILRIIKIDV
jgi:tight adherence protein B